MNGVEEWRLERNCMSCNESEMQGKNAFVSVQLLSDNSYRNEQTDINRTLADRQKCNNKSLDAAAPLNFSCRCK